MTTANLMFFVIIFGVGASVLIHVSRTISIAGEAANKRTAARYMVACLWLWAALAIPYALLVGDSFLWLAPSLVIPLALLLGSTFAKPVTALLEHVSVHRLVGVQVYRVAGSVFLMSHFWFDGYISREFAINAGWGDVLTGVLAFPVALAAWRRIRFWQILVVAWCILGTSDLIVAPVPAQIYGGPRSDDFPINTIPIFFGPPLGICLHLVALRALWLQRARSSPQ